MIITKTNYIQFLTCPTLSWMRLHTPSKLPVHSVSDKFVMEQGIRVGIIAHKLFPFGSSADCRGKKEEEAEKTANLLKLGTPIYEAGFFFGNLYARVDILVPIGNEWDIYEVKSASRVKDDHKEDVAFQLYVLLGAGIKVRKCFLVHVNGDYVLEGTFDENSFLKSEDITLETGELLASVPSKIREMEEVLLSTNKPEHCQSYSDCPVKEECWGNMPEHNIFTLTGWGKKAIPLFDSGIREITDIPNDININAKQKVQMRCVLENRPYIDSEKLSKWLSCLKYPLYYFDFEACNPCIPCWQGTKPYQQIPFQFSIHVQEKENGSLAHFSFIYEGSTDPRPALLKSLKTALGDSGSIVVFYQSFELSRLWEMAEAYPKHNEWIRKAASRVVDLIEPFKKFWCYYPAQKGSCSIKSVLPALTGCGYNQMDIADGKTAGVQWYRATTGKVTENEKQKIFRDLKSYCALDTEGMALIVEKLRSIASKE